MVCGVSVRSSVYFGSYLVIGVQSACLSRLGSAQERLPVLFCRSAKKCSGASTDGDAPECLCISFASHGSWQREDRELAAERGVVAQGSITAHRA